MDIRDCAHCHASGMCKNSKFTLSPDRVSILRNNPIDYSPGVLGKDMRVRATFTLFCVACGHGNGHPKVYLKVAKMDEWVVERIHDDILDWANRELEPGWWEEHLNPPICSFCKGHGYVRPGLSEDTPSLPENTPDPPLTPDVRNLPPPTPKRLE